MCNFKRKAHTSFLYLFPPALEIAFVLFLKPLCFPSLRCSLALVLLPDPGTTEIFSHSLAPFRRAVGQVLSPFIFHSYQARPSCPSASSACNTAIFFLFHSYFLTISISLWTDPWLFTQTQFLEQSVISTSLINFLASGFIKISLSIYSI